MRLLYAATHLKPDLPGGVAVAAQGLAQGFLRLGLDIRCVCVSARPEQVARCEPLRPVCARARFLQRWGLAPGFARVFRDLARQADVVMINGVASYPMTVAGWLSRSLRKPYLVAAHGHMLPDNMAIHRLRKALYYRWVDRANLRHARAMLTTSEVERACMAELRLGPPCCVVPNGTELPPDDVSQRDLPPALAAFPSRTRFALYLGRLHPRKRVEALLDAWTLARDRGLERAVKLLIVGHAHPPGYRAVLLARAAEMGLSEGVIFHDEVRDRAKWAVLQRASVVVLPSLHENFGLVLAEALACGTPAIAHQGTPWEELEQVRAGRWIPPTREALADALLEVLSLPEAERRECGRRGRALVLGKYTWPMAARRVATVLLRIRRGEEVPLHPAPVAVDASGKAVLDG